VTLANMSVDGAAQAHTDTGLDPVTYEVIRHRLWSVNEEACTTMTHVSGSPVVHASDLNFGIYTAAGDMAVVGTYYMIPIGTMALMVRHIVEDFGARGDVHEGDIFFCNDPFVAAAHQNDVQLVAPFFHGGRLVGWTGCTAHELDVGGMEPGSWCPRATDVFQEGIRIPPVKLRRAGELQRDIWNIITNASRLPRALEMDLNANIAAHTVAHRRLAQLCDRYGADAVAAAMEMSLAQSEVIVRERLLELPDGDFEHRDFVDHDGHTDAIYDVVCTLRKRGDSLTFDFTGSSPQAPGFINSTRAATTGAIAAGLFVLLGADAPSWNEGILRPVEILLPEASLVDARPPAPVSASSVAACLAASHCVNATLSRLIATSAEHGDEATAGSDGSWLLVSMAGVNQYDEPYGDMFLEPVAGGGGAYAARDGIDSGGAFIGPTGAILDVETKESGSPVLYLWRRQRQDTGGPGRHRGGVSIEWAFTPYDTDAVFSTLATHGVAAPNCLGLFGGYPGSASGYELVRDSDLLGRLQRGQVPTALAQLAGERVPLEAKTSVFQLRPGDVLNSLPQGGGGWGDPLVRTPDDVAADVVSGLVSREVAAAVYGVSVDDHGGFDAGATTALRERMLRARLDRSTPPESVAVALDGAEAHGQIGDALAVVVTGDELQFRCATCDHPLGASTRCWKAHAARLELSAADLGATQPLDPRMVAVQYLCPGCGTSLDVEVSRADLPPSMDIKLI
jgi:N-methylhydantoinase B